MLYFKLSNGQEILWQVGEPIPKIVQPQFSYFPNMRREVISVYADGDELAEIQDRFPDAKWVNLPIESVFGYGITYRGSDAKMIHKNL